jgi:hypothetical protein
VGIGAITDAILAFSPSEIVKMTLNVLESNRVKFTIQKIGGITNRFAWIDIDRGPIYGPSVAAVRFAERIHNVAHSYVVKTIISENRALRSVGSENLS